MKPKILYALLGNSVLLLDRQLIWVEAYKLESDEFENIKILLNSFPKGGYAKPIYVRTIETKWGKYLIIKRKYFLTKLPSYIVNRDFAQRCIDYVDKIHVEVFYDSEPSIKSFTNERLSVIKSTC